MRKAVFWAVLAVSALIAWGASRPPAPRPASAPATAFSAERAFAHVRVIGRAPHPTGSVEAVRVRAEIARRLRALGMRVEAHAGVGVSAPKWAVGRLAAARVQNIVATLPGLDPGLPALALMSHSDSVANSPGAADDAAGVAASIEIVRAIGAGGRPLRDLMVVVTDGEEAGLLGAEAFFATDPAARRLGAVINLETRGSGGRAQMFETAPNAGGWTDLFRHAAPGAQANALSATVYRHMPNGTDFTQAIGAGLGGLNIAFSGRQFDYHTAHATPAALDLGSLQSMGDQALGAARAVLGSRPLPLRKPDAVYFNHPLIDLFGAGPVGYPAQAGWALIAIEALLLAGVVWGALHRDLASLRGAAFGAAMVVAMTLAAAVGLWLLSAPFGSGSADIQLRYAVLGRYPLALAAASLIALALALGVLRWARSRAAGWSLWLGALGLLFVLAAVLQADEPTVAFMVAWPLLAALLGGAAALALGGRLDRQGPVLAIGLFAVLGASLVFSFAASLFSAVGVDTPVAFAVAVPLAAVLLVPLAAGEGRWLDSLAPTLALILGLIALAGAGGGRSGSVRAPALTQAFYFAEPATGRFERASAMPRLDAWSRAALTLEGGRISRRAYPPVFAQPLFVAPARAALVAPARFLVTRSVGEGPASSHMLIRVVPGQPARELRLRLRSTAPVTGVLLEGRPVRLLERAGQWSSLSFAAPPPEGISVELAFAGPGAPGLEIVAAQLSDGWPGGVAPPPLRAASLQPWSWSDTTQLISRLKLAPE